MSAPLITVRRLDASGDPMYGQGTANFLTDGDAVAQIIGTRLRLLEGEWWESLNTGTPLFQNMLGIGGSGKNPQAIALILTERILGTTYVTGIQNVSTSYNDETRAFAFSCGATTQFGAITVTFAPANTNASLANE